METDVEKKFGTKVSLNIPAEFSEIWMQFQYIISKDKKIPDVKQQKPELKKSLAIRRLIKRYVSEKWDDLFVEEEYLKFKDVLLYSNKKKIRKSKPLRKKDVFKHQEDEPEPADEPEDVPEDQETGTDDEEEKTIEETE